MFDTSKPPPHITTGVKRTFNDSREVRPSKLRKSDDIQVPDSVCEKCIQREISCDLYIEKLKTLNRQKEYKKILYKNKSEETENLRAIMRILFPNEIFLAVEEYIDVPMQLTHTLFEDRLFNSNNMMDSIQSSSVRELLLEYLLKSTSASERLSPPETWPDLLCSDMDVSRSMPLSLKTSTNELCRLLNPHRATKHADTSLSLHRGSIVAPTSVTPVMGSGSSESCEVPYGPPPVPASLAATPVPAYQPAVPPPAYHPYQPAYPPYQPAVPPPYASTGSLTMAAFPTAARVHPAPGPATTHNYGPYTAPGCHSNNYLQ